MRTLAAVAVSVVMLSNELAAQKPGASSQPAAQPARGRGADPWVGTFSGQELTVTLQRDGSAYSGTATAQGARYPLRGMVQGNTMVGQYTDGGVQYQFQAQLDGTTMQLAAGGAVYVMQKQAAGARQGGLAQGGGGQSGGTGGGSPQDRQLTQLLLRSPWCSFSYVSGGGSSGRSSTERVVFQQDGTGSMRSGSESYYSGPNGSVAGQGGGGDAFRWRVQNGQLIITDQGGASEAVPLTVTQNSNGYPIINANGKEYSMCN